MNGYYIYGSQLYGTTDQYSDVDIAVIGSHKSKKDADSVYSKERFEYLLSVHEPTAMEGYSLQFVDVSRTFHEFDKPISIEIDKQQLRGMYSNFSSNSFVKAKKKLTVLDDYDRRSSMKSLFHSLRIPMFGIQIAQHGHIVDFRVANDIYNEIVIDYNRPDSEVLELISTKYKIMRNSIMTEFREYAPKK